MSDGFSAFANQSTADEMVINLDFGLETTGGLASFGVVEEGTHRFGTLELPEVNYTKDGEVMVVLPCQVVESNVPLAVGQVHTERLVIPGDERKQNDPKKWEIMMKMLRMKLEAITGKTYREDNIKLRISDLHNCTFIATSVHSETEVTDDYGNATGKKYTNANLTNWQAAHNVSQQSPMPGFGGNSQPPGTIEPF